MIDYGGVGIKYTQPNERRWLVGGAYTCSTHTNFWEASALQASKPLVESEEAARPPERFLSTANSSTYICGSVYSVFV